jgi:beta-glucosidase
MQRGFGKKLGVLGSVILAAGLLGTVAPSLAASAAHASAEPRTNPNQPPQRRAKELLAAMTQSDKIGLITGGPVNPALGIPKLGSDDGPNGLRGQTNVTAWPAAENVAASFDPNLANEFGTAMGQEAWGKGIGQQFGPTVNIIRTPYWGREAETFGEDPYLSGQIAAAEVAGMESQHVIATVKHFAGNNQETDRFGIPPGATAINDVVSERALQEIYFPAFKAAVTKGGAGSVMCATNSVDGFHACENSNILGTLINDWGFQGSVIPDTLAVRDPVAAFNAGTDGGISASQLTAALAAGTISKARLDAAVLQILTPEFAAGQFDVPNTGSSTADVSTPAHQQLATQISEEGSVLLRNQGDTLPLSPNLKSVAVIGEAANPAVDQVEEGGSAYVTPSSVISPIAGITSRVGPQVVVNTAEGSLGDVPLPALPSSVLTPSSGSGSGLTATYYPTSDFTGTSASEVEPSPNFSLFGCPAILAGSCTSGPPSSLFPSGVKVFSIRWTGTLTPPETGDYRFSVLQTGGGKLVVGGRTVLSGQNEDDAALGMVGYDLGAPTPEQAMVHLTAGVPVSIELDFQADESLSTFSRAQLGWETPSQITPMIQQAAAAAAKSTAAVVFVNQMSAEGMDRNNLDLPGDQNELISAVAKANPNTIVVLNTPGPVLMPWLDQVKSVVEAWMPGQQDGQAIAALLFGDVAFSGHLPITWPASPSQGPGQTAAEFPGVNNNVYYREGIFVGYRYYQQHDQTPLYPFGYGLTDSRFAVDNVHAHPDGKGRWIVTAKVTNTGSKAGSELFQLYVGDPQVAGEPPEQLKGFARVTLQPEQHTKVSFEVTSEDLSYWNHGTWSVAPGSYQLSVGTSSSDIGGVTALTVR